MPETTVKLFQNKFSRHVPPRSRVRFCTDFCPRVFFMSRRCGITDASDRRRYTCLVRYSESFDDRWIQPTQPVKVEAFRSERTIVTIQVSATRYKTFHILFGRDGSLFVMDVADLICHSVVSTEHFLPKVRERMRRRVGIDLDRLRKHLRRPAGLRSNHSAGCDTKPKQQLD